MNLTKLSLAYCTELDRGVIFDVIFKFQGLTELDLSGLQMESLPEGFGQLTNLTELNLRSCKSMVSLPEGIHYSNSVRPIERSAIVVPLYHHCTELSNFHSPKALGN